jgi:ATP-dependent Zn protease
MDIRIPEKGTGFDNFIPKKKESENNPDDSKSSDDKPKKLKIDLKTSFGGSGGDKKNNSNNNQNKNNDNSNASAWMALALLLGVSYWINSKNTTSIEHDRDNNNTTTSSGSSHREITWSDFLRLLQQQDIQKVVIANATASSPDAQHQARVYLKPNAMGLARWQQHSGGGVHSSSSSSSEDATSLPHSSGGGGGGWDDPPTTTTVGGVDRWTSSAASQTNNHPPPFYYRLAIGSLESFERKLDDAERRLGRSPDLDVPVQYTADAVWTRELWSIVPGVLLALGLYGMMRFGSGAGGFGATGGGGRGGGGGAGGIFSIGKSTAKKIAKEDVNVTFAQVAGCDDRRL